jgi:hypothetical protein
MLVHNRHHAPIQIALALLLAAFPVAAQAPVPSAPAWTIDDILLAETASGFAISPDGRYVAWTKSEMDRERGRRYTNLWVTRVADGEAWALTRGTDSFGSPRRSPDGRLLAFTSSREVPDQAAEASGSQLWLLRMEGGEPWPLTKSVRGQRQFEWKGTSSDSIVFAAQEAVGQYERAKKKRDDTRQAVEDTLDAPPVRLWLLEVGSGKITRLTDQRDPIESMALSPDGNVETRQVLFPGEPHGLGKLAHQRRKVEEEMRWLDRHLWGRADTAAIVVADGSPLARDSLEVGRFEVTRAQWKEYDPLDHWAGYPVNPDDAPTLRDVALQLRGRAALLLPVGSLAGDATGAPAIYDLGGNVAEWAVDANGAGIVVGRSADQAADPAVRRTESFPRYRVFRVVVGQPDSGT